MQTAIKEFAQQRLKELEIRRTTAGEQVATVSSQSPRQQTDRRRPSASPDPVGADPDCVDYQPKSNGPPSFAGIVAAAIADLPRTTTIAVADTVDETVCGTTRSITRGGDEVGGARRVNGGFLQRLVMSAGSSSCRRRRTGTEKQDHSANGIDRGRSCVGY